MLTDATRLSILYKQVYIQTYGTEGVTHEFANFITKKFSIESIEKTISTEPDSLIVAVYKTNLVGVAEIVYDAKCPIRNVVAPELGKLYVLEWFCGKGVGYGLLKEAEALVKRKEYNELWLWVYVKNLRAVHFYERQQYKHIGNAPFQMEVNSYDNHVMRKVW